MDDDIEDKVGQLVYARFSPKVVETLKPEALDFIGREGHFEFLWIIDEGKYQGQWAMRKPTDWSAPFVWVPYEDLTVLN
ncbi:hypothetical protein [Brucella pseudogrignonensis]|uniref:hypothetical protein n=1 Tax=Brucella pseudogrignonensis TaxID=419475 RepID=UPI003ECDEDEE